MVRDREKKWGHRITPVEDCIRAMASANKNGQKVFKIYEN